MPELLNTLEKKLFPYVKKPFRYTGGELNSVVKDPSEVILSGVLCFPEIYDIGMSHFGSSILYNIVNNKEGWEMKRCYHPANDAEAIMRSQGIPLYALEDLRPVSENHWLGFTVQYELQYTNILNMLDLSRIPLFSESRTKEDPLVIAGGPCIANPEPLSEFIDVFSLGDGEVSLPEILGMLQEGNASGEPRLSILRRINTIENVYVPLLEEREHKGLFRVPDTEKHIKAAKTSELKEEYYSCRPVVPLLDVVHHRLASEVMRGCSRGCRFCSAGYIYRPVRERAASDILNSVKEGADNTGWRDVTLLSLSTADHSGIEEILEGVNYDKDKNYSFPSTRADALSEERLETLLKKTGTSSFTIAPEAGTERLRRIINKDFTDETVVETSCKLFERGVKTIKLYFMIGLPMERDEDIEGIWRLVERVHRKAQSAKGKKSINVSLSPFTPKPHTPFQRETFNDPEALREKSESVLLNLKKYRDIKISYRNPYMSCLETILSRGDRDVCKVIHRAWEKGALFDGWDDCLEFSRWEEAADDMGIDFSKYLREIPEKEILPWSFADYGITEEFLKAEIELAKKGERTPDCRYERCAECGVCAGGLRPLYKKSSLREIPGSVRGKLSEEKESLSRKKADTSRECLRFKYYKKGRVKFLSHLNTIEVFKRAFTAAGIPVCYSMGYKKKPRFSFAPPLPYGITGENELFDVLVESGSGVDIQRINTFLPEGLKIKGYERMNREKSTLNKEISKALYRFTSDVISTEQKSIQEFMSRDRVDVEIEKKDKRVIRNLRELVLTIEVKERCFEALLMMEPGRTCRPADLIQALYPDMNLMDFNPVRLLLE